MTDVQVAAGPQEGADEADLLDRLADDLDEGFAALYERHRRLVHTVAARAGRRYADAEDVTAETFLRAYRALRGYDRERIVTLRPRSWLATIALNLTRNRHRSAARAPAQVQLDETTDAPDQDPGTDVAAVAERAETGRELAALLGGLTARQREAVVLRHVTGLSVTETAAAMDLPENTVKSHVARGLRRLRDLHDAAAGPGGPADTHENHEEHEVRGART